ncbi:MAG: hypothetical protein ACR2OR_12465 [Hyphomicrobiales bacterium]
MRARKAQDLQGTMEQHWDELNTPIPPPSPTQKASLRKRSLGLVLLLLVCSFIFVAGSILAFYFLPNPDLLFGERRTAGSADKLLHVEFAGDEFVMPEPVVRTIERSVTGNVKRIELRVPWPFAPERIRNLDADELHKVNGSLFISFERNTRKIGPGEHVDKVLKRYFVGRPMATNSGLVRYQFAPNSPYPDGELYIGALKGEQVIIQCEPDAGRYGPSLCERVVEVSRLLNARYRFHRNQLDRWREVDATARELISTFRVPAED